MTAKKPKLLERARQSLRQRNYSYRTEQTYLNWMKRFILFHNKRHPKEMGEREIESYLTYLAVKKRVAPSTQNQALNALIYLYEQVLGIDLDAINALRPRKSRPFTYRTHLPGSKTNPRIDDWRQPAYRQITLWQRTSYL